MCSLPKGQRHNSHEKLGQPGTLCILEGQTPTPKHIIDNTANLNNLRYVNGLLLCTFLCLHTLDELLALILHFRLSPLWTDLQLLQVCCCSGCKQIVI